MAMQSVVGVAMVPEAILEKLEPMLQLVKYIPNITPARAITYTYCIPPPLAVHFPMTHSVRYQPIFHTLYFTLRHYS